MGEMWERGRKRDGLRVVATSNFSCRSRDRDVTINHATCRIGWETTHELVPHDISNESGG